MSSCRATNAKPIRSDEELAGLRDLCEQGYKLEPETGLRLIATIEEWRAAVLDMEKRKPIWDEIDRLAGAVASIAAKQEGADDGCALAAYFRAHPNETSVNLYCGCPRCSPTCSEVSRG